MTLSVYPFPPPTPRQLSRTPPPPLPARRAPSPPATNRPSAIDDALMRLLPEARCELTHRNAFELLIAVILSAQTTDKGVNLCTPGLFARFPTPAALAAAEVTEVEGPRSDRDMERAMWFNPSTKGKKPLLVGLHTWSSTFASAGGDAVYAKWCIDQGWIFIHPDFRGPNWTPPALGSDRAVQDVVEAVAWAKTQAEVDDTRVHPNGVRRGGPT